MKITDGKRKRTVSIKREKEGKRFVNEEESEERDEKKMGTNPVKKTEKL